jgi:hypothetical protein
MIQTGFPVLLVRRKAFRALPAPVAAPATSRHRIPGPALAECSQPWRAPVLAEEHYSCRHRLGDARLSRKRIRLPEIEVGYGRRVKGRRAKFLHETAAEGATGKAVGTPLAVVSECRPGGGSAFGTPRGPARTSRRQWRRSARACRCRARGAVGRRWRCRAGRGSARLQLGQPLPEVVLSLRRVSLQRASETSCAENGRPGPAAR